MTRPEHPALAGPRTFLKPAPAREQQRHPGFSGEGANR